MAVASAGPYAIHLHLATDRQGFFWESTVDNQCDQRPSRQSTITDIYTKPGYSFLSKNGALFTSYSNIRSYDDTKQLLIS